MVLPENNKSRNDFSVKLILAFVFFQIYQQIIYNCNTLITSTGVIDLRTFAVGDTPTFCVHFLPYNVKIGFQVTVDTYQAITLRHNFEVVSGNNTDLAFQVSNSLTLSQQVVGLLALYSHDFQVCVSCVFSHHRSQLGQYYTIHFGRYDRGVFCKCHNGTHSQLRLQRYCPK